MTILDGKHIAEQIRSELKQEVQTLIQEGKRVPQLAIVQVGHIPASDIYVGNKLKACAEVGFNARKIALEESVSQAELLQVISNLNSDAETDGFIVQLPLPEHIDEQQILASISFRKDVDGLSPENVGRTMLGMPSLVSATPKGIRELMARYHIPTEGKHVVVIGRSNIVGKPVAMLLMQKPYLTLPRYTASSLGDATVTICHSKTRDLKQICRTADIIIVAAGQPALLTADMVKDGCVVIDVGINRVEDSTTVKGYRLAGDVDFDAVAPKCSYITPVPGGVGPMTIASLLQNTMQAYLNNN